MGDVVDFTAIRLAKGKAKPQVTMDAVIADSTDFLLGEWEKMARNNRLNDYFKRALPNVIEYGNKTNFMADITAVAGLEMNMSMFPMMFAPGTRDVKQMGWVVSFFLGEHQISTPELANEAYARCFGILLYLKVKHDALAHGLIGNGPDLA